MSDRWWDPASPAVDLLTPGGDRHLDTANALFALHRSGAAALNAAAATPLVDESVISKAATSARSAYSEDICEALGEVLGDPTYAGLLVRDIADAAETTSLAVYRSCVSKGVPPPLAAQRAALVYGVPPGHLGVYQSVASNPTSKDIAVVDAADRALFGWASAASTSELGQVSKSESPAERRTASEDQPRGGRGRWGRRDLAATVDQAHNPVSIAGMSAEDWVASQILAPVEETTARPVRERRQRRELRTGRVARTAQPAPALRASLPKAKAKAARPRLSLRVQAMVARDADRDLTAVPTTPSDRRRGVAPVSSPAGGTTMPLLNADTVYITTFEEWRDLENAARREGKGPHEPNAVYVTGEALRSVSNPGAFAGTEFHEQAIDDLVDEFRIAPGYHDVPQDIVIEAPQSVAADIAAADNPTQRDLMLDDAKRRYLSDYLDQDPEHRGMRLNLAEEVAHISYLPDYHTGAMVFVWRPPNPANSKAPRTPRVIAEITVDSRNARGEVDPGTRHGEGFVDLDPNTMLRVDRSRKHSERMVYDSDRKVAVVKVDASVADPFSKAETPARRRAASADQPRRSGLFAARAATPQIAGRNVEDWVSEQMAGARAQRELRTRRTQRTRRQPAALIPTKPAVSAKAQAKVALVAKPRAQLAALTRLQLELRDELPSPDVAPFADGEVYTVLGARDVERRLNVGSQAMVVDHALDGQQTVWLRGQNSHAGDDALEEVNQRTFTDETNSKLVWDHSYTANTAGEQRMQRDYLQAAGRFGVTKFTMQRYIQGDQLRVRVKVHDVTDHSDQALSVFRWNSTDADRTHDLHFQGQRRVLSDDQVALRLTYEWHAAVQGTHGPSVVGHIANPWLNWWDINDHEQ